MDFQKDELIYLARIAEQGERFEEMIGFVKEIVRFQENLTPQERNLLSVCFKNSVSRR
jgi:14-3-3 protein epsilon